ncbi:ABC transporter permease [Sphingobium chungangianum]
MSPATRPGRKPRADASVWRKLGFVFYASLAWLVLLLLFAFVLPLQDPLKPDFIHPAAPFSPAHLLGTDALGRDMLARVAHGARISVMLAVTAPAIGLAVALPLGVIAGYAGGIVDRAINILNDTLLAFPRIILAIGLIFYAGATLFNLAVVISIFTIPNLLRIIRATTLSFANREFVLASRALGASHFRIIWKDILPNVLPPTFAYALMTMSVVVVLEGSLSFLGIGVPPPTPSWGKMIFEGHEYLFTDPQLSLVPSAVMFLTILSLNLIGDQFAMLTNSRDARL